MSDPRNGGAVVTLNPENPGSGYENFGLPAGVSITINTVVETQFHLAGQHVTTGLSRFGGPATTIALGSVDVVDAYRHGAMTDVIVQSAGADGDVTDLQALAA